MDNKNETVVINDDDLTDIDDVVDFSQEDIDNEETDWKQKAINAQKLAKERTGIAKRRTTALKKVKEGLVKPKPETPPAEGGTGDGGTPQPKKGLDLPQKTYLLQKGIGEDYFDKVEEAMESSGKTVEEIVNNPYFKSEHETFKTEKAAREASPEGGGGSGEGSGDTVEGWVGKEGLPPLDGTDTRIKLRGEIVKARIEKSKKLPQ